MATDFTSSITTWYQAVQYRTPPAADLAVYNASLQSGALTAAQVQASIGNDPYTVNFVNPIIREYQAAFGRVPDQAGVSFWATGLANGTQTLTTLGTTFANSAEFLTRFGATATTIATPSIVTALYTNVLGRAPDAAGLAFWQASGLTAAQLLNAFAGSAEFVTSTTTAVTAFQALEIAGTPPTTGSLFLLGGTQGVGSTFVLTTGVDTFTGTSNNDTFVAGDIGGVASWTPVDSINGGAGVDTFTVAQAAAFTGAPAGATVSGVEIVNVISGAAVTLNTVTSTAGFTGLTNLNTTSVGGATVTSGGAVAVKVTDAATAAGAAGAVVVNGGAAVTVAVSGAGGATAAGGVSTDTVTVGNTSAPTGAVSVTVANALVAGGAGATTTAGAIAVTGGTTISVTETQAGNATGTKAGVGDTTLGAIAVTGSAATTAVTVVQSAAATGAALTAAVANTNNQIAAVAGIVDGAVTIADANAGSATAAGTIASVTLQNYGASTISSSGLTALTLSATGTAAGTLGLTSGLTTGNPTTLALNLGGGSLGAIADTSNKFKTVNANLTANTTLAGITDTALTTLNVAGSGVLTLTGVNTALTSVGVTGTGGLKADLSGATGLTSLAFTNSGTNTVTLNATNQAYSGGTGADVVTITADATKAISGGTGTNTLVLNAAAATFTAANTVKNVTGFTTLGTNTGSSGTYDLSVLTGFNAINVGADVAGATVFSKVAAGSSLTLNAATTAGITYQTSDTAGATDTTTVTLKGASATGGGTKGYTVNALTIQDANAVGHGTVNIATDASVGGGAFILTTLTDSGLSNLAVTGTGSLTITNAATTSTSLTLSDNDTSTATSGITTLTSTGNVLGNLAYSGTHAFTIGTLTDAVANLTITNANTGTSGVLTVTTFTDAALSSLTLNGSVALTTGTFTTGAALTVNGATDNSVVSITTTTTDTGVKTITLGNGNDTVVTGTGADKITLGTGANTVTSGAGADTIVFGTHTGVDKIVQAAAADSGSFTAPVVNSISTASFDVVTGLKLGDQISLATYAGAVGAAAGFTTANAATATTLVALAATDNNEIFVRGTFDATGKTFVGSATGTDTLVVYDGNSVLAATAQEAIVLVGYVASSVTGINAAAGLITLG